jgi:hypothetical protein
MVRLVSLALALATAEASCDMQMTFADMHDGDEKEVTIKGSAMTIKPANSEQQWVVNTEIDCATGKAVVDFNVPGKDDHPPVPLTATLYNSLSAAAYKTTFVYTDPSGTLADAAFPLNQWVAEKNSKDEGYNLCPKSLKAVFADMHDGDMKEVTIDGDAMTIKPSGNHQEWTVNAVLDRDSCSASVDFNVPGKPDFPPVPLTATYWSETVGTDKSARNVFEFTDPSGTLAAGDFPLNRWIQLPEAAVVA